MLAETEPPRREGPRPQKQRRALSKEVAGRIRAIRRSKGKTLLECAKAMKTTPQTAQRLETANMTMSVDWLQAYAEALDVHPSEFFAEDAGVRNEARLAKQRLGMLRATFAELCRQVQDVVPDLVDQGDKDAWPDERVFQFTIGGRYQDHMKLQEISKPAGARK